MRNQPHHEAQQLTLMFENKSMPEIWESLKRVPKQEDYEYRIYQDNNFIGLFYICEGEWVLSF